LQKVWKSNNFLPCLSQGKDAASSKGNGDDGGVEPQHQRKAQQYNYTIKKKNLQW
jgi:hypothetical protein